MTAPVYMDHNASAPLRAVALASMQEALAASGNASSVHGFGRAQRRRVDQAREAVAHLVGAKAGDVIFTANGSEANNLALANRGPRRLVVSAIEHDSVLVPANREGATILGVDGEGRADLEQLDKVLGEAGPPAMVSLMLANNETGVIQPVAEAAAICARHAALLHCDATQAAGRLPVKMSELGADMLTISAHKIGGPQGAGALLTRRDLTIAPMILGGGQERYRRAGTENVSAIAGFGAAAAEAADLGPISRIARLRDRLEAGLRSVTGELRIFGAGAERLANTSCVAVKGMSAETLVMALDLAGYAISAGSACSSGKMRPSHVVRAMGYDEGLARGAIRVSLGPTNREDEIEGFVAAFAIAILRHKAARNAA